MTRNATTAVGAAAAPRICTVCPLLCADLVAVEDGGPLHACAAGAAGFGAAARWAGSIAAATTVDGGRVPRVEALDRAARVLAAARRVLVTGLADAPLEAIATACDLAEALGAAVDAGNTETAQAAGPTIARGGEVTAEWDELRDRADLVIYWFCDPTATHPRFNERFVAPPPADGGRRRTIAIGPETVLPSGPDHRHLPLTTTESVAAARLVHALVADRAAGTVTAAGPLGAACRHVHDAITAARCIAIVTVRGGLDAGLEPWSIAGLVRAIAHERPAFEVPLAGGVQGSGANVAGVASLLTWRYGAAGAIARADRGGAEFLPAEADALRLVDRDEVDCVLAVGRMTPAIEAAVAARGHRLGLVRIAPPTAAGTDTNAPAVVLACDSMLTHPSGTMLRGDGRRIVLGPVATAADSLAALLADLLDLVRGTRPAEATA